MWKLHDECLLDGHASSWVRLRAMPAGTLHLQQVGRRGGLPRHHAPVCRRRAPVLGPPPMQRAPPNADKECMTKRFGSIEQRQLDVKSSCRSNLSESVRHIRTMRSASLASRRMQNGKNGVLSSSGSVTPAHPLAAPSKMRLRHGRTRELLSCVLIGSFRIGDTGMQSVLGHRSAVHAYRKGEWRRRHAG